MLLTINDIKSIAEQMKQRLGIDYPNFNMSLFRRRINYLFDKLNIHRLQEFNDILTSMVKADEVAYHMSIPNTELFRDPSLWRSLVKHLKGRTGLRVWIPNLTNCYDLYSLLVVLKLAGCTDFVVDVNCVSGRIMQEVKSLQLPQKTDHTDSSNFERLESEEPFDKYFEQLADHKYQFRSELFSGVKFRVCWFMNQPVEKYDLVIFRNVVLEYSPALHERSIQRVCESMADGGLLALGIKERIINKVPKVSLLDEQDSLYVKADKTI